MSAGRHIEIRGVVQGVGFRPWVYRLARSAGLTGSVGNDASGVFIDAFGARESDLDAFVARLRADAPAAARIETLSWARHRCGASHPPRSRSLRARRRAPGSRRSRRTWPSARRARARSPIRTTVATATRSRAAPSADRASPSPATSRTTARRRPWRLSRCAPTAFASTRTRATGASTPSRTRVLAAGRRSAWSTPPAARSRRAGAPRTRSRARPSSWRAAPSSPSRASGAGTWPATRRAPTACASSGGASIATRSRSR